MLNREAIAAVQHEIWAHWMEYLFSVCQHRADGSVLIPPDLVTRWQRQVATDYSDLTESEKESDRNQAAKVLEVMNPHA